MRRFISIIFVLILVVVLSSTNPKRSEYIDWMNQQSMDQSSNILQKGFLSVAGKTIFDAGTTEKDYYLFTIYKTDFSDVGMGTVTALGIFNQFIPLSKK
ncbi:hypothetical protein [Neobacillus dielmonensis]|uniref:hypothetical protein n=1 Tax=Neobacillus dielmonensis TaxID=1347369 RepID=UPI0005AB5DB7|nr:hypothetical protein [Neobacillus dielmonensis]